MFPTLRFTRITISEPINPSRAKMIVAVWLLLNHRTGLMGIRWYPALPTHPAIRVTAALLLMRFQDKPGHDSICFYQQLAGYALICFAKPALTNSQNVRNKCWCSVPDCRQTSSTERFFEKSPKSLALPGLFLRRSSTAATRLWRGRGLPPALGLGNPWKKTKNMVLSFLNRILPWT